MKVKIKGAKTEEVVKEAFWLAWQACGGTLGMGFLQNNPAATKDEIWNNVVTSGDYPGRTRKKEEPYGDYVFGRMMKLGFSYDKKTITFYDSKPRVVYQAWRRVYASYQKLIEKAVKNVGAQIVKD